MTVMAAASVMSAGHGLGRDRFGAISSSLGIARRLLYAAGSSLRLSSRLLSLGRRSFRARSRLVSFVGRIDSALRGVHCTRRAAHRKCKGQCSPGSQHNKFRGFGN
jgi:hypothetical protein